MTLNLTVQAGTYASGNLSVQLLDEGEDDELYATVSVDIEDVELSEDEFVFKTYSENEGLLKEMLAARIVRTTGRFAEVGYAGLQPICRLLKQ